MTVVAAAIVNNLLSGAGQLQVQGENLGVEVLADRQGGLAAPILDFDARLEAFVAFLLGPARAVQFSL